MTLNQAIDLIRDPRLMVPGSTTWADLGSGEGLFTRALASLLQEGSKIFAVDKEAEPSKIISPKPEVSIEKIKADFVREAWPFHSLDGLMMANSFHFVDDKQRFIGKMLTHLNPGGRILIIEYDMDRSNHWVPYPISFQQLDQLFAGLGLGRFTKISERASAYNRSSIYSAWLSLSVHS
jgi:ubiquinone/menaquinone biosynthesis C-methylase UbiE